MSNINIRVDTYHKDKKYINILKENQHVTTKLVKHSDTFSIDIINKRNYTDNNSRYSFITKNNLPNSDTEKIKAFSSTIPGLDISDKFGISDNALYHHYIFLTENVNNKKRTTLLRVDLELLNGNGIVFEGGTEYRTLDVKYNVSEYPNDIITSEKFDFKILKHKKYVNNNVIPSIIKFIELKNNKSIDWYINNMNHNNTHNNNPIIQNNSGANVRVIIPNMKKISDYLMKHFGFVDNDICEMITIVSIYTGSGNTEVKNSIACYIVSPERNEGRPIKILEIGHINDKEPLSDGLEVVELTPGSNTKNKDLIMNHGLPDNMSNDIMYKHIGFMSIIR